MRMVSRSFLWSSEPSGSEVRVEDDGAEVADGGFFLGGVERDLGAEIATSG